MLTSASPVRANAKGLCSIRLLFHHGAVRPGYDTKKAPPSSFITIDDLEISETNKLENPPLHQLNLLHDHSPNHKELGRQR
jgi:hypothetical protein